MRGSRPCLLALLALLSMGCRYGEVVRVVDGEDVSSRFIPPAAYAAYAQGALAEADGDDALAREYYRQASSVDSEGVLIWTRLAAVSCRLDEHEDAKRAFAQAAAVDEAFQPIYHERARCELRRGRFAQALKDSERAVDLDPSRDASLALLLESAEGASVDVNAEAWRREARVTGVSLAAKERVGAETISERVDRALLNRQPDLAQRLMWAAKMDAGSLGVRALLLGRSEIAMLFARRRLRADPHDSDSRVLFALAADLSGHDAEFAHSWNGVPRSSETLSLRGRVMMVEILIRHAGLVAAAPWLGELAKDKLALAGDPIARRLLTRIELPDVTLRGSDD